MKDLYKFTVKDGDKEVNFTVVEPTRAVTREGDDVYARYFAKSVRSGLLTNEEAIKLSNERGGILSASEKEEYSKILAEYVDKDKLLNEKKADEDGYSALKEEVEKAKSSVLYYQNKIESIFQFTAQTKARDMLTLFYALSLTYQDGKPFFDGKDFDAKLKNYDSKNDAFFIEVARKAVWYATLLYFGLPDNGESV